MIDEIVHGRKKQRISMTFIIGHQICCLTRKQIFFTDILENTERDVPFKINSKEDELCIQI